MRQVSLCIHTAPSTSTRLLNLYVICLSALSGSVFLIHTELAGQKVLRLACGGVDQAEEHIDRAWGTIEAQARLELQR